MNFLIKLSILSTNNCSIIEKFKQQTTFEEFVGSVYNPNGSSCVIGGGSIASVTRSDLSASLVTQDTWTSDTEPRPRAHTGLDSESSGGFRSGQSDITIMIPVIKSNILRAINSG